MLLGCNNSNDAPTTGDDDAAVRTPMLVSYRASTSPVADHLLLDKPEQPWLRHQLASFFCRLESKNHTAALAVDKDTWTASVRTRCKAWLTENPVMNTALLLWLLCVGVSGGMLVLLLLGLLDGAFPVPAERKRWIEINNQVLNALFTLMSVYQHPALCHHLFLLCRWRLPHDVAELRAAYCECKEGSAAGPAPRPRPGERAHMAVVVALLQVTVACQYVLCGLYWGCTETARPEGVEDVFFVLGVVAPVAAAVYTACSPLGRAGQHELFFSMSSDSDDSAMDMTEVSVMKEQGPATPMEHVLVVEPGWAGGMFDCADDPRNLCLSASCTFCVFGWNAERLGLGNRYVHAITFALLCFAPLWVFGVSALHIHDFVVGDVVGGAGVLLCACGLLYGGYWRTQMRRKFGLPPGTTTACCGSASVTDYARWLFCWPCALAQEVRTASHYHVDGESFFYSYRKVVVVDDGHEERQPLLESSHHYDDVPSARDDDTVVVAVPSPDDDDHKQLVVVHDDEAMVPPVHQVVVLVQVEDDHKSEDCSGVVHHGQMTNSSSSVTVITDETLLEMEYADQLSNESWKVDKVKKLINMVTLLSLLILFYTRGFIR